MVTILSYIVCNVFFYGRTGLIPALYVCHTVTLRLGNALQGTIPGEISLLTSLTELSLWVNQLSGTIPSTLGLMSSMQLLYLYENEFVGTIPSEIYSMTNLVELDLAENMLSGAILSNIGLLMNLGKYTVIITYLCMLFVHHRIRELIMEFLFCDAYRVLVLQ